MSEVVIISANISEKDKAFLDSLVVEEVYDNRSQALREAIKLLRNKELYTPPAVVYNNNHLHMTSNHKPRLCEFTQSYSVNPELRMNLMNELKDVFRERGLVAELPTEEVDAGFEHLEFDPDKCKEALMEDGCVVQCPNYCLDGEDYCHQHIKKKNLLIA